MLVRVMVDVVLHDADEDAVEEDEACEDVTEVCRAALGGSS